MDKGDEVRFLNNCGEIDPLICTFIENAGNFCRIKKPSGEIIRIHRDRVHLNSQIDDKPNEENETMEDGQFDPWASASGKAQVWIKSNSFSDEVISETIAIIEPNQTKYKSINTYNGKASKIMSYNMKSIDDLVAKLEKRGYKQAKRP